jgi:hypothetical protein
MPQDPGQDWIDELWDIICEVYKLWGGDCRNLPPRSKPKDVVAYMWNVLNTQGPPDVSDPAARARLFGLLERLEKHLANPDNSLEPQTNQSLLDWIAAVRKAVGGGT